MGTIARSVDVTIDIKPAVILANEAAYFTQFVRSATGLVPCDELDDGTAVVRFMP